MGIYTYNGEKDLDIEREL